MLRDDLFVPDELFLRENSFLDLDCIEQLLSPAFIIELSSVLLQVVRV